MPERKPESIMLTLRQVAEDFGITNSTESMKDLEQVAELVRNFVRNYSRIVSLKETKFFLVKNIVKLSKISE